MVTTSTGVRDSRDNRDQGSVFAITNHTVDAALDCDSTSDGELADVLGTLIQDLIRQGILNGTVATA